MASQDILQRINLPALALFILGASELVLIDISADVVKVLSISGSGFFVLSSAFLLLLTCIVMLWSAVKEQHRHGSGYGKGMASGVKAALEASVLICVLIVLLASAGRGIDRLLPPSFAEEGAAIRVALYAVVCLFVVFSYCALGAAMGALAGIALEAFKKEKKENAAAAAQPQAKEKKGDFPK